MVSASNWQADDPGLLRPEAAGPIYLVEKSMDIVESNRCYTPVTLTCIEHKKYPNVAQAVVP